MKIIKSLLISLFVIGTTVFGFEGEQKWTTVATYDNEIADGVILNEKYSGGHPKVFVFVFVKT